MQSQENNAATNQGDVSPTAADGQDGLGEASDANVSKQAELNELQELVKHSIGAVQAPAEVQLPDPESIERISADRIKSMRQLSLESAEVKAPLTEQIIEVIIRAYSNFMTFFVPPAKERRYCELKGHECKHCGQVIPPVAPQQKDKPPQPQ
jgi:hypothetical protein